MPEGRVMGSLPGKVQTTLYADPEVLRAIKILSAKLGRPIYDLVDDALRLFIKQELSAAELKAFNVSIEKGLNGVPNKKARSKTKVAKSDGRAGKKARPKSRSSKRARTD